MLIGIVGPFCLYGGFSYGPPRPPDGLTRTLTASFPRCKLGEGGTLVGAGGKCSKHVIHMEQKKSEFLPKNNNIQG